MFRKPTNFVNLIIDTTRSGKRPNAKSAKSCVMNCFSFLFICRFAVIERHSKLRVLSALCGETYFAWGAKPCIHRHLFIALQINESKLHTISFLPFLQWNVSPFNLQWTQFFWHKYYWNGFVVLFKTAQYRRVFGQTWRITGCQHHTLSWVQVDRNLQRKSITLF